MMNSNNFMKGRHSSFIMDGGTQVYSSNEQHHINQESMKNRREVDERRTCNLSHLHLLDQMMEGKAKCKERF
jgi:hypothetical protein